MTLMCSRMKLYIAVLLWSSVCITESWAVLDQNACMTNLLGHSANGATLSSSSSAESTTAESVFTSGWCANENQQGDMWIDVNFPVPMGIRGVVLQTPTKQGLETNLPRRIDFLYVPVGGSQLQQYATNQGPLTFSLTKPNEIITNAFTGIATKRIRFLLKSWSGKPCFQLQILGCPAAELCPAGCSGRGQCLLEENCLCDGGSTGAQCELNACNPVPLGLADGRITGDMITASSSTSGFSKDGVASNGWCPEVGDHSPWLQVKLPKPMLVSVFVFKYIPEGGMYMETFHLKFRPATGAQQQLLDFGEEIPALNGTHFFNIRVDPPVVTDTIRIIPVTWNARACFRLDLQGCDPVSLCQQGWCLHGGSCMGQNACLCPNGFLGSRCETTANNVPVHTFEFTKIEHNVLITTSYTFAVHGTVTIRTEGNTNVLYLNGQNSFVSINKNQTSGCIADVDMCSSGFTYGLDLYLERTAGLIPILSSGGDLPNGNGLSLFYTPGDGFTFIVSTITQVWTLHVKYNLTLNSWHRYEISWNKLLGVSLYIDGHLLGSVTKPAPRLQPATVTRELCLGCSYTSTNTSVHMMVRDFRSWSFSRGELVHANAIPTEPTTNSIPTTIPVTTTHTATTTDSSSSKTTSTTTPAHNTTTAPLVLQRSDVECQTTSLKIFVPKNLVPGNGTVTWRDSACVVHSNGTHFVDSVGLRDCGTTLTLEADSVVFENDLILHKNGTQMQNGNNIVTYGSDYEFAIPVKCVYPRNSNISTSYIPIVQQVRIMERRNGQLDLTMRQYEAEDYSHPVPFNAYPRQVPLNNDIFIRLAMENNVTGLGLSADNCFATSTPSPVDQNWYQLISSGCPVNNAKIHPSGINDVKFSFHAFNFRHNTSGIVYVHCQVSVCLDTDPACVVGCMTRKKRSASAREGTITSNLISTGPFILTADEGGVAMSTVVAAVSIAVAVIATVVAIIGWTRKSKKGADS